VYQSIFYLLLASQAATTDAAASPASTSFPFEFGVVPLFSFAFASAWLALCAGPGGRDAWDFMPPAIIYSASIVTACCFVHVAAQQGFASLAARCACATSLAAGVALTVFVTTYRRVRPRFAT
jgi:hypothetical protein